METLPLIFDIQRFALDDGPGIRTSVFFKGCPLACVWCHNPESMLPGREISFAMEQCIGSKCASCGPLCEGGGEVRELALLPGSPFCSACGKCAYVCPTGARQEIGSVYTIEELCSVLYRDIQFYRTSGGGVTLSGGEPTLHHEYISRLLRRLKKEGIHAAIQTCGDYDMDPFCLDLLPLLDLIYFDLKLVDPHLHRRYTGKDNETILKNLCALALLAPERLVLRVPLVPGITATRENLAAIARLVRELGIASWELLPYNPWGISKRRNLSKEQPGGLPELLMGREEENALTEEFCRLLGGGSPDSSSPE